MQTRSKSPHRSKYPNPISFELGDRLVLGRRDTEFSGWIWVTTLDGNQGWAPEQYLETRENGFGYARRAYTARELNTEIGDRLVVLTELNEWLWVENDEGVEGWVPRGTTEIEPC